MHKILLIFGTRPEAIKLCPVVRRLREDPGKFDVTVCVTAQHREMLDQVLAAFEVKPDHDLDLMLPGQTLFQSTSRILAALEKVFKAEQPRHGDRAGRYHHHPVWRAGGILSRVPVAHVEAGLRTGDLRSRFPEEMNRVLTSRSDGLHFAATEERAENLRRGRCRSSASITSPATRESMRCYTSATGSAKSTCRASWPELDPAKKLIVVTAHRRESFGGGFERICRALRQHRGSR